MRARKLPATLLCIALLCAALAWPPATAGAAGPDAAPPGLPPLALFGVASKGAYPLANVRSTGMIERWHTVMARHQSDNAFAPGNDAMKAPMRRQWDALVAQYPGMPPAERLRAINAFFNLIPGVSDEQNYGQQEYWAYPAEFIRKNGGDCEDYALAKYLALRQLGWPGEELWLVLVKDLQRKADHAVLAVNRDGRIVILDNLSRPRDLVMPQSNFIKMYSPILAINAVGVWNFSLPIKQQPTPAAR